MPTLLSYEKYYLAQMKFIDRFIRRDFTAYDEARVKRIKALQPLQSIHFLPEFLQVEAGKELETTRMGYKPLESANYSSTQLRLAPDKVNPENRRLTRYRLVYGPVDFYLGSQFDEPTEIPLITACAPNMMGSSKADLEEFSTGGRSNRRLKAHAYEKICNKLALFIVDAAKSQGKTRLIMPPFGVGVYINTLDSSSQDLAKELMYKAFADAAEAAQLHIDWIVWAKSHHAESEAQKLKNHAPNHPWIRPVIHQNILDYAKECQSKQEDIVLLNPGSDRTIGGAYPHKKPKTLEEQMAQQSDLLFLHSDLNQSMVETFKKLFLERKAQSESSDATLKSSLKKQYPTFKPKNVEFKTVAEDIHIRLEMKEVPWIFKSKENYKISFKDKTTAQTFANLLAANGIVGRGPSKTIQSENKYHVIYLTENEFNEIPDLKINPAEPPSAKKRHSSKINAILTAINAGRNKFDKQERLIEKVKKSKLSLAEYSELYNIIRQRKDLNRHRNPYLDSFWGIKNISSWRKTLGEFRKQALLALEKELQNTKEPKEKLKLLEQAKSLSLFKEHRNNAIRAFGKTAAVKEIEVKTRGINGIRQ